MGNFQSCQKTYNDLEKHIDYLKRQNDKLQDKVDKMEKRQEDIRPGDKPQEGLDLQIHQDIQSFFRNINDEKINELVDKILENDSINFTLIPDEIEKQLYHNMIKLILTMISDTLE